jgi:hypothetical protein
MGVRRKQASLLLLAILLPTCVDPLPATNEQTMLCSTACRSHTHAGMRRMPFLQFARQQLLRPLAALTLPRRPISISLLTYLSALRGIRGGATTLAMSLSDCSRLGWSDLVQTSTATSDCKVRLQRSAAFAQPQSRTEEELYNMKLIELQRALRKRGVHGRGLKCDLVERLKRCLDDESKTLEGAKEGTKAGKRAQPDVGSQPVDMEKIKLAKKKQERLLSGLGRSHTADRGLEILREVKDVHEADFVFEIFPSQAEAFKFVDARPGLGLQVYSQDKSASGAKSYVAATTQGFWRAYRKMEPVERHFGEIIREGIACRLYFDVEFRIEQGENVTASHELGCERVDELIKALHLALGKEFPQLYAKIGPIQVMELDSSSDVKFSRHLIIPNVAFLDNLHAGSFVKRFVGTLPSHVGDCVDLGVYTRNRCFRIVNSSKFGKSIPFQYSERTHPFKWTSEHSNTFMKMMHLQCFHSGEDERRSPPDDKQRMHLDHQRRLNREQNRFMHSLITYTLHQDTFLSDREADFAKKYGLLRGKGALTHSGTAAASQRRISEKGFFDLSPFPALDHYVCEVVRPGAQVTSPLVCPHLCALPMRSYLQRLVCYVGVCPACLDPCTPTPTSNLSGQGSQEESAALCHQVQQWTFTPSTCRMTYSLLRNRFCENANREHKSNRVLIICDLARGVWRQRCLDPDCTSFRGREWPLAVDLYQEVLLHQMHMLRNGCNEPSGLHPGDGGPVREAAGAPEVVSSKTWALREEADKLRREGARSKISASIEALASAKARMLNGSHTHVVEEKAPRQWQAGTAHVRLNASHCSVTHAAELWQELRAAGFRYELGSKAWVVRNEALLALLHESGASSLLGDGAGTRSAQEMTQEMVLRLLEEQLVREETSMAGSNAWALGGEASEAEKPVELRLHVRLSVDRVLVRGRASLSFDDRSRLLRLGFRWDGDEGWWAQSVSNVSRAFALGVGSVLDEVAVLKGIAAAQPCRVQVQGRDLLVRHGEYAQALLEAHGFVCDETRRVYVKQAVEVARLVRVTSVLDITAQAVMEALESHPEGGSAIEAAGAEESGSLALHELHVRVGDGVVSLRAPSQMISHLTNLGFSPAASALTPPHALPGEPPQAHIGAPSPRPLLAKGMEEMSMSVGEVVVRMAAELESELHPAMGQDMQAPSSNASASPPRTRPVAEEGGGIAEEGDGSERAILPQNVTVKSVMAWIERSVELASCGFEGGLRERGNQCRGRMYGSRDGKPVAVVTVDGAEVRVSNGYELKDRLRALGFRWHKERRCWALALADLSALFSTFDLAATPPRASPEQAARRPTAHAHPPQAHASANRSLAASYPVLSQVATKGEAEKADAGATAGPADTTGMGKVEEEKGICVGAALDLDKMTQRLVAMTAEQLVQSLEASVAAGAADAALGNGNGKPGPSLQASPLVTNRPLDSVSDWSPSPSGPDLQVQGEEVTVERSYDIKDELRDRGFRWEPLKRLWTCPTSAVLSLLGIADPKEVTIEAILAAKPANKTAAKDDPLEEGSSDRSAQSSGPELRVNGEEVTVSRCYDIKDCLRGLGFRWNALNRCCTWSFVLCV